MNEWKGDVKESKRKNELFFRALLLFRLLLNLCFAFLDLICYIIIILHVSFSSFHFLFPRSSSFTPPFIDIFFIAFA